MIHVDQANLVFEALDIEPSRMSSRSAMSSQKTSLPPNRSTSCSALVSCTTSPSQWSCSRTSRRLVGHTSLSILASRRCRATSWNCAESRSKTRDPRSTMRHVMFPTRRAVLDMVGQFGYHAVALQPRAELCRNDRLPDRESIRLYCGQGHRPSSTLRSARIARVRFGRIGWAGQPCSPLARSSAGAHLAPRVHRRRQVVRELLAAYRRRAKRMSDLPLN